MANLKKLKILDLSRTNISELPSWLSTLPMLHTLELGGSSISKIPQVLKDCKALRKISLYASRGDYGHDSCPLARNQKDIEKLRQMVPWAEVK